MYLVEFPLSKITKELEELELVAHGRRETQLFVQGARAALIWMAQGDLSPSQQLVKPLFSSRAKNECYEAALPPEDTPNVG